MTPSEQKQHAKNNALTVRLIILVVVMVLFALVSNRLFNTSEQIGKVEMSLLAQRFADNVVAAHWQWRAAGEPNRIVLNQHSQQDDGRTTLLEQRPLKMNYKGWPDTEQSMEGCRALWRLVLDKPLTFDRFHVYVAFSFASDEQGQSQPECVYSLNSGEAFSYRLLQGQINKQGL